MGIEMVGIDTFLSHHFQYGGNEATRVTED